ncbi:MAG: NrtA/SsuA/CpmA family ABC transporter substrate-binding protein [Desulfurivibrionaceae bacterium]|nr:NrtA/SsuA/CpmA family ABC transporter substrate-binding protein [Desulfurivibrionaceae bacterium]
MPDCLEGKKKGAAGVDCPGGKLLLVLLVVLSVLLVVGCKQRQEESPTGAPMALEPVALCRSSTALLPVVVAEKQGFFAGQGLAVSVREAIMGKEALERMFRGECDLATAAEPPVVEYVRKRDDFRLLGALQNSDNLNRIVARADHGVTKPEDLRGKRIGTAKGTAPHYFLELFLEKHGLASRDVAMVFMKSDELLGALTSGKIDAVSMTNKVVSQAQEALQGNAVLLEEPGLYRNYYLLVATTKLLEKRPEVAVRFLRALAKAEEFIRDRPEETLAIAQASHGRKVSSLEIKQLLEGYQYRLTLDHAMLMGLEETARWMDVLAGNGRSPVPNFLAMISPEPLRTVQPDGVRLEK